MELICPACSKVNQQGADVCGRCGCDLTVLWSILQGAAWHLTEAGEALRRRDANRALGHAEKSWMLRHSPESAAAGALAAASAGRADALELWRSRCRELQP